MGSLLDHVSAIRESLSLHLNTVHDSLPDTGSVHDSLPDTLPDPRDGLKPATIGPTLHMRRLRSRKSLVLFGIGLVVFAACLPGTATLFTAVLTPLWIVVPAALVVIVRRKAVRSDEQTVSLLSLLLSRAPPILLALA